MARAAKTDESAPGKRATKAEIPRTSAQRKRDGGAGRPISQVQLGEGGKSKVFLGIISPVSLA